jgi:hypothetical protein
MSCWTISKTSLEFFRSFAGEPPPITYGEVGSLQNSVVGSEHKQDGKPKPPASSLGVLESSASPLAAVLQ